LIYLQCDVELDFICQLFDNLIQKM